MKEEQKILKLERAIALAPEGELYCWKVRDKTAWYCKNRSGRHYLNKSERAIAEKLAQKKYNERLLAELRYKEGLTKRKKPAKSSLALLIDPMYRELILPGLTGEERAKAIWMTENYSKNPVYREECIFKTPTGECVRSKSEYIIYCALLDAGLMFRYDSGVSIEGHTIYPDFVIMHPKTGQLLIWEHFGRMDDPAYAEKNLNKLKSYNKNGWILMKNLLITTETSSQPLDIEVVRWLIDHYFFS